MVLNPIDKPILKRLRVAVKREQLRTGKKVPPRVLKFFKRLKNIDPRKREEWAHVSDVEGFIRDVGRKSLDPGYAVRVLRVKGTKGIVLKYPTLAYAKYNVTPTEEIRYVRRIAAMVNEKLPQELKVVLLKPIGHEVGPFIAMQRITSPTIEDVKLKKPEAIRMISQIAKQMHESTEQVEKRLERAAKIIQKEENDIISNKNVTLSENVKQGMFFIENKDGPSFMLRPLDWRHLHIVGQKNGIIQIVSHIDAV
jgi:hypothetical protein